MSAVQKVFVKYRQMRHSGLEAKAALDSISDDIEMLSTRERQALSGHLRELETEMRGSVPAGKTKPRTVSVSAASSAAPTEPHKTTAANAPSRAPAPARPVNAFVAATVDTSAVTCRYCGATNKQGELMCVSCGRLLMPARTPAGTEILDSSSGDPMISSDYFGENSLLIFKMRDTNKVYEVHPQTSQSDVVMGRSAVGSSIMPDVDLKDQGAERQGVSRLHVALRYDAAHHTISVLDLESANGSFINGQRIHPQEVRILRDGDELRLGKLAMKVSFAHSR